MASAAVTRETTRLDTPGLFRVQLGNTRATRTGARETAAVRQARVRERLRKRSHPPSQLRTLSAWRREY